MGVLHQVSGIDHKSTFLACYGNYNLDICIIKSDVRYTKSNIFASTGTTPELAQSRANVVGACHVNCNRNCRMVDRLF